MSHLQQTFDISEFQKLLDTAMAAVQARPIGFSVVAIASALGGYSLKRLLAPSAYPNLDGPPRKDFLYGHLKDVVMPYNIAFHDSLQDTYGSVSKVYGSFGSEQLFVSDPRFMHEVLVKEADTVFRHPQYFYDINNAAFGLGLTSCAGHMHKMQRKMLNPVFTVKHMKSLVSLTETFYSIANDMKRAMIKDLGGTRTKEIDMLRWCSSTALELIGTAGIGHSFGILHGVESEYSDAIKNFFPALAQIAPMRSLFPVVYRMGPSWLQEKLAEWAPNAAIREMKHIVDVQERQAQDILSQKKKALNDANKSKDMNDIMSVLLKANMEAREEDRLPEDQLIGQMNTLIFAGHETTSGSLTRTLHLLASHTAIQDRLQAELQETSGSLSYDELNALPYLDALCREVLRLYTPSLYIERVALKDWLVPLRYPVKGKDGSLISEIHVRKGTKIYVSIKEANRSRETWGEDADEFKPERWLRELPQSVADARTPGIYSSMMTFSGGPRSCIGFKFSILEMKIVLSTLVKSFKFAPGSIDIDWLACIVRTPYTAGTKDVFAEGVSPHMPLVVTAI
ncbi:Cytochrome P450 3A11 [Rhizoctonia solani AG-1 IB]|uniref:Cytochrome P450 3A11 n=1 Tax=Thanatephorus cucumeris (strain AG1-IB / isolate 7/3/14) TaxID=1108050 RepID=M5C8P7_THACB|nr:Cytochrome P450 3A11 [Rhizoctonia solani AG-1 IB]